MWKRALLDKDFLLYLLSTSENPAVPALLFMSICEGALLVRSAVSPGKGIQGPGLILINWSLNPREGFELGPVGVFISGAIWGRCCRVVVECKSSSSHFTPLANSTILCSTEKQRSSHATLQESSNTSLLIY